MPDDLSNRGAQDRARINMSEPPEVKFWAQKWSISEEELKRAVTKAGTSAAAVAKQPGKAKD